VPVYSLRVILGPPSFALNTFSPRFFGVGD